MVYLPQTPNAYTDPKLTKQLIKSNISVFKVNPSKPRNITEVVAQTPSDPTGPNSKPNGKGKFILKKDKNSAHEDTTNWIYDFISIFIIIITIWMLRGC